MNKKGNEMTKSARFIPTKLRNVITINKKGNEMTKSTSAILDKACDFARALGDYELFDEKYSYYREYTGVRDSIWLALKELFGVKVADSIVLGKV